MTIKRDLNATIKGSYLTGKTQGRLSPVLAYGPFLNFGLCLRIIPTSD